MSLSVAITIIAIADVALIAGLAYVMSRATRLTPHVSARTATAKLHWRRHAHPRASAPLREAA
jgi:hypothetical protein